MSDQTCVHASEKLYPFELPGLGERLLCWDCRRAFVLRLHLFQEPGLHCVDLGRLGYQCKKCGGSYTSTDPETCSCPGRAEECAEEKAALERWMKYAELVLWRPGKSGAVA